MHAFQSESKLYICLNVKEFLNRKSRHIWSLSDFKETRTHNRLVRKQTLNPLAKLTKCFSWILSSYLYGAFDSSVNELLTRNSRDIWSLNDCKGTRSHNDLVCKQTLNRLAKLTKWLTWIVSTYLYGAFDSIIFSCYRRVSEWIHTLYLPEYQGTPYSKQSQYLKFKWMQPVSNPQRLSLSRNTQPFSETDEIIELNFEYGSVRCI